MNIDDVLHLFMDGDLQYCNIYDFANDEVVFSGYGYEIPEEYLYCDVCSIDNITEAERELTFNIHTDR